MKKGAQYTIQTTNVNNYIILMIQLTPGILGNIITSNQVRELVSWEVTTV